MATQDLGKQSKAAVLQVTLNHSCFIERNSYSNSMVIFRRGPQLMQLNIISQTSQRSGNRALVSHLRNIFLN